MANKGKIQRNEHRKLLVERWAEKRVALKKRQKDPVLSIQDRFSLALKLDKLPKNSSRIRVRRRCQVTGRPRGLVWAGISREEFRQRALSGQLPGVLLSSW